MNALNIILNIVPFFILIMIFYFILIRPQKMELLKKDLMIEKLKTGNRVETNSGIVGKIKKIKEKTVIIETGTAEIEIKKEFIEKVLEN